MKELNTVQLEKVNGGFYIIYADNPIAFEDFHGYPMPDYLRQVL